MFNDMNDFSYTNKDLYNNILRFKVHPKQHYH